jgi:hypothetical protein
MTLLVEMPESSGRQIKEFSSVDIIIPPWFSTPIHHLEDEQ